MPDIIAIRRDGRIDVWEVQSPYDSEATINGMVDASRATLANMGVLGRAEPIWNPAGTPGGRPRTD